MSDAKPVIVIAEDSPPNRKILAHLLNKLGFDVIQCENGQQAWDELSKPEQQDKVLAIISDIMMPGMDGLQLLKNVRGEEKLKKVPFVLVTAVSERDYVTQAKELSVNGYLLKPITFQRVHDKLKELFPDREFPKLAA
jgi:two-component system chemotaxis response regulator CheY